MTIPCSPNDNVFVIDCVDIEDKEYMICKDTIYAVIVKEDEILLTCNGSGYYQWILGKDAFLSLNDAVQKYNTLTS